MEWAGTMSKPLLKIGSFAFKTIMVGGYLGHISNILTDLTGNKDMPVYLAFTAAGMEAFASGNPTSLIITGMVTGIQALVAAFQEQHRRKEYDDHPEKNYASKFGYIRSAGVWYPAFISSTEKWYGKIGQGNNSVRITYGKDLSWIRDKDGTVRPVFTGWSKERNIIAGNHDLTSENKFSRKGQVNDDGLRNWYFLTEDEQATMFASKEGLEQFDQSRQDTLADYGLDKRDEENKGKFKTRDQHDVKRKL